MYRSDQQGSVLFFLKIRPALKSTYKVGHMWEHSTGGPKQSLFYELPDFTAPEKSPRKISPYKNTPEKIYPYKNPPTRKFPRKSFRQSLTKPKNLEKKTILEKDEHEYSSFAGEIFMGGFFQGRFRRGEICFGEIFA